MTFLLWAAAIPAAILCLVTAWLFAATIVRRWFLPCHPDMDFVHLFTQNFLRLVARCFFRHRYLGLEHIPKTGPGLIICNHVSFADVALLWIYLDRPIRFLSWDGFEKKAFSRAIMRRYRTIPVSASRAKEAMRLAADCLKSGQLVAIFPEGQITRSGSMNELKPGYELIARLAHAPVIPAHVDNLWGSFFSHHGDHPVRKILNRWPRPVTISFGAPLAHLGGAHARRAILDLGATAFALRPELNINLGKAVVLAVAKRPGALAIVDRAAGRTAMSGARLLAVAHAYAAHLRRTTPEARVGIMLPPGIPATVANLACVLAGKTPVNLNFTLGRAALEHCFAQAGIQTVLTVDAFRKKISEKLDIPWPAATRDVLVEMRALSKPRILAAELALRTLPGGLVAALGRTPAARGDAEAALLFTSGSSGTPKGVVLTHRNLLANAEQVALSGILPDTGSLLANLPVFHSFGHTVTLWLALTHGIPCVCVPSPLEITKNIEAIRDERVTCLIGTPTFYRGYFKKAARADLASVSRIIAGAEKTPAAFAQDWKDTFGGDYFEGYGATETSPVASVNIPDYADPEAPGGVRPGTKPGSVGRLVVGMSARITHPDTGEELGFDQPGLLALRGANVFPGYLNDPKRTAEALHDGWYATGDIVRLDREGFLFIEGRLSRFSKIGGEMVPHGAVEEAVIAALQLPTEGEPVVAIAGRADPQKGESLVLLTTLDIDADALRRDLAAAGLANLWIPKTIVKLPRIPVLATGKLDLQGLKQAAAAAS